MKPKEFDGLIRQKFDQNDFAYNPDNWEKLAEKLEGREKKRSIIIWWWLPLAGMAASVALALGVTTLLRQQTDASNGAGMAKVQNAAGSQTHQDLPGSSIFNPASAQNEIPGQDATANSLANNTYSKTHNQQINTIVKKRKNNITNEENDEDTYGIDLKNARPNTIAWQATKIDLTKEVTKPAAQDKQAAAVAAIEAINTFKPEDTKPVKPSKLSIILSGGYNHGNQNSGYMAGGTIRRMLNDKVYIESDVALASTTNTQSTEYLVGQAPVSTAARQASAARTTSIQATKPPVAEMQDILGQKNVSYDLYYAQVTPSIGYKVMKRMSVGVGPDFQQALADNRPAPSSVDRGNIQVAPLFDVGFVGKTEYALTKKVKAGIYYRKGVNNIITPMDKYIERDYLQFQVKYTIFNK